MICEGASMYESSAACDPLHLSADVPIAPHEQKQTALPQHDFDDAAQVRQQHHRMTSCMQSKASHNRAVIQEPYTRKADLDAADIL